MEFLWGYRDHIQYIRPEIAESGRPKVHVLSSSYLVIGFALESCESEEFEIEARLVPGLVSIAFELEQSTREAEESCPPVHLAPPFFVVRAIVALRNRIL
ncbi:hypothetical protein [Nocardia sp. NBC_00511]|uniref:hypothetical protein n=1 Tax=Nocardia sp. NBC_00511 TaxID=2903591 RepID=UPI0030DEE600